MHHYRPRPRRPPRRVRHRRHTPRRRFEPLTRWQQVQRYLGSTILGITVPTGRINIWLAILGVVFYILQMYFD